MINMPKPEGLLKDGDFHFRKTFYCKNADDMAEFEKLMYDQEESVESVIDVTYHDTHVEVIIKPGW